MTDKTVAKVSSASTAINAPEPPAAIAWPKEPPTADELIRYAVARACWLNGAGWAYVEAGAFESDGQLRDWHMNSATQMIHLHDIALLLREMKVMDGPRADRAAEWIWRAADAGDSYGEWLWQWASEAGLDPDALYEAGGKAAEHRIAAQAERPTEPAESGSSTAPDNGSKQVQS